ncbi:MAG: hypothetical protein CME62_07765 [Halobacteriovoraceae bacterium]|nr:hypothetical protein [Halobacteriovoraceae bacterium]|tara:strand:+ start:4121 stop:4747 length:627 start_codon:yes stop_codon:yes gene_type:complete
MRVILRFLLITLSPLVWAQTSFEKAVDKINEHELLNVDAEAVVAIENEATAAGSWGDPRLSLAAINYPKESLANDESMMTGIQVGIMQTVSLSGKYGKLNNSMLEKSQAAKADKLQTRRNLLKKLWELAITQEKLQAEKAILSENYKWLDNNLKVSKKLYTNGKIPQQAVLDIQIRKSELALQIAEKNYALDQLSYQLGYVLNQNEKK